MREELARLREAALAEIASCRAEAELEAVRIRYLGRKGSLTQVVRGLATVPPAERPALGALVNQAKEAVEAAVAAAGERLAAERLARSLAHERIDVTLPGRRRPRGHAHPLRLIEDEIVDLFVGMGFRVAEGPEIEDDYHNFAALNFEPDHPARDAQDTLFVASGADVLLRTHTSPVQIRVMRAAQPPLRVVVPGTVYRRDDLDPTHSPMFQQVEGFMVDERVSFADLKGVLVHFLRRLFGPETGVRFRPSFFPFTEPSAEVDIACFRCAPAGAADPACRICRGRRWLEVLGAGMIHPNVLRAVGYDSERVQGFAFGLGTDRIAILRYGIEDLRLFYENDLRFLAQFPS
ncbi:MAG: phenylalanine--tRNA ligase subunit alpha [Deltaproteobacteria bacterium]|nr:MAG: phenylalanine--tRNA ligase subunit alpha [Deltaproteobacteria bacterium]TMA69478.1 MAG: phenylalanine--tRNA ligase subunit alpha [Deltaproteobacteria bacterium]TMB45896.1 MAG: phenylalanine--tRNA ligase subunit alpha [Deltaproteobacteria bacterium]